MDMLNNNIATLAGKLVGGFENYHNIMGEEFLITHIEVRRRSGGSDVLPVIISEKLLDEETLNAEFIKVTGQIRTFNKENGSVETYLFAKDCELVEEVYINEVKVRGFLCKKGMLRTTYTERKVIDFILAVNRLYGKSDYLTILAWGKDAKYISNKDVSTEFELTGRFQSRNYLKKNEDGSKTEKIAYEISASQIVAASK